jgi:peptidoglycan DL-endopeptidase CwlO
MRIARTVSMSLVLIAVVVCAACAAGSVAAAPLASTPRTLGDRAVAAALSQQGAPYVWGQESPATGFDSSGLVVWSFAKAGMTDLPHYIPALWTLGHHVSRQHLRVGDLVFFDRLGHVGIYVGANRFVHAPHTGEVVRLESLSSGFYARHYVGAIRLSN